MGSVKYEMVDAGHVQCGISRTGCVCKDDANMAHAGEAACMGNLASVVVFCTRPSFGFGLFSLLARSLSCDETTGPM